MMMNKTICILPHKLGLGGPASFQGRLIKALKERGVVVTHDGLNPANSAILMIGGTRQIQTLWRAHKNGVKIVQRLNGMNWVHRKTRTGLTHFIRAEVNNWILSTIRKMADRIVYQSQFTRDWWTRVYGETKTPGVVIYNGVDLTQFTPSGGGTPPLDFIRILLVEGHYGGGYEQGLDSAVRMVRLLNQRLTKKVELQVVGSVPERLKNVYKDPGIEIEWRGVVGVEEIPVIDRSAHILFSSDINAACPNSVIEAMACGLPVIGYNTGALPELIANNGGSIAPYGGDPWNLDPPSAHSLADAAGEVLLNLEEYRRGARNRAVGEFDIQRIADQYMSEFLAF
ncbi:MAG: glycosyltransferase family 4 protein [Chloroflexi bacterium]|nr:glycosyltransferase family 4 protein [Chloroflexota bacterium]